MPGDASIYVMGGYLPNGGTRMAYEIALLGHQHLGLETTVVVMGHEQPTTGVFTYPIPFNTINFAAIGSVIRPHDLLICNPSFSDGTIGLRHQSKKLMYVQGFTTFSTLDRWFDCYVAVGSFVRDYLHNVYALDVPIIPPFIDEISQPTKSWWSRPANSVLFHLKGNPDLQGLLLDRLKSRVAAISPVVAQTIDWETSMCHSGGIEHSKFLAMLEDRRYFVSLSVAEGFGLVPLEAMAAGCTVLGFDGFGGRDYMGPQVNCAVRPYPDIEGVARDLVASFEHPDWAASIAAMGPSTAARYSKARFSTAWRPVLEQLMSGAGRGRDRPNGADQV